MNDRAQEEPRILPRPELSTEQLDQVVVPTKADLTWPDKLYELLT
jgi:hypothetical protein